jgi:phosphopantothenoylcysteine synthetase/decarboxylase
MGLRPMTPVLLVGGAPRVRVDAVRFLQARASGTTARALRGRLAARGVTADLLLSDPADDCRAYDDRAGLETALRAWIADHPDGTVVMSAAINDWQVETVQVHDGGAVRVVTAADKAPSRADALTIRLVPASKVLDQLRGWGLRGAIIGFKFEDAATVIASAQAQLARVGCACVVANSLDGSVQALVDAAGVERFAGRDLLLDRLAARIAAL